MKLSVEKLWHDSSGFLYIFLLGLKAQRQKHSDYRFAFNVKESQPGKAKIGLTGVHSFPDAPFPSLAGDLSSFRQRIIMSSNSVWNNPIFLNIIPFHYVLIETEGYRKERVPHQRRVKWIKWERGNICMCLENRPFCAH